ncbi:MAG: hypothetical protein M9941_14115 [Anaerolineae bacterium]|nr:hypothetical protein [Anaerolineae bacterium]
MSDSKLDFNLFGDDEEPVESAEKESGTIYDKIESESTVFGKILSKIPGFSGMVEKSRRREADQMVRSYIVRQLEEARLQLGNVQSDMSGDILKAIDYAEPIGRIDTRLMGLIGKIDDAPVGYAGLFDAVKIKEEELAEIYDFDAAMLDHADYITAGVAALSKAVRDDGDISSAIRDLNNAVTEANTVFAARQDMLAGIE